ncbi:NUDIX domain-containing protein [Agromyces sp. NPDC058484]|uniref:NUDIX hydrolase n=1 Tax=Agromyces sp. NPDC058484 TaxID=3346524 RepID=UPI0036638603
MTEFRDTSGKALTDYPRPSVAVDTAVLTVPPGGPLSVVLTTVDGDHRLPGTFLHEGEVLADAARRALAEKTGVRDIRPYQLRVFDALGRDDRGWVLSVAHYAAVPWRDVDVVAERAIVVALDEIGRLAFDHNAIVELAVARLRREYRRRPDPFGLLDAPLTMRDLQRLHEAVAGERLMRDTFRRRMEPLLEPTGALTHGTMGKPAREFRTRG